MHLRKTKFLDQECTLKQRRQAISVVKTTRKPIKDRADKIYYLWGMLGLGNSLTQNSVKREVTEDYNYTESIIGSSDGWEAFSVPNDNYTLLYNQPAPDGTDGWMKLTLNETQTDFWTLQNSTLLNGRVEVGSTATISYKIFLDTAALWGDDSENDDDDISWQSFYGGRTGSNTFVTAGSTTPTSISNSISAISTTNTIQLRQGSPFAQDFPLAGAEVYIKDLSISVTYT